jgi:hypothetical protein
MRPFALAAGVARVRALGCFLPRHIAPLIEGAGCGRGRWASAKSGSPAIAQSNACSARPCGAGQIDALVISVGGSVDAPTASVRSDPDGPFLSLDRSNSLNDDLERADMEGILLAAALAIAGKCYM